MRVGWQRHAYLISCIDVRTVIRRVVPLAAAAVTVAVLLQGGSSQAQTVRAQPSLKDLVAQATQLSNEVDSLGQQFDGLKIQLAHANSEVKIAKQAAARAQAAMAGSQKAVAQLAAMGYMNGGMDPTLQMLTSGNPDLFLSQASTVQQLNNEAGMRLSTLQREQVAAQRAQATAKEEIATANQLQSQINGKVKAIHSQAGRPEQLGDGAGDGHLQQDGLLPRRRAARGHQRRHDRAAGRADPARQALRLGRGRARTPTTAPA